MEKTQTIIRLDQEKLDKLDIYAKKIGLSRNQLMNNLLDTGLDDLYLLEKTGMLTMAQVLRRKKDENRQGQLKLI